MKTSPTADTTTLSTAALALPARPVDDEADDWLGCEAMHPLTWLPSLGPAGAAEIPTGLQAAG